MNTSAHPSLEKLQQFVLGKLTEDESINLENHILACETCSQQLNASANEDSLTQLVRELPSESNLEKTSPIIQIAGYEILSELGRGGMGVVYKALDLRLKRFVALKVILNGEHANREQRDRLRQEAETIATLQHPGIVQIYEIGEHQGHLYLALELLDAQGLQTVMKDAPHSAKWSAALIAQLAEIIAYSHQCGIIHRDLKPENILFSHALNNALPRISQFKPLKNILPIVKITDFGLAKCLNTDSQMTKTGLMLGTPHYMSPEQIPDSGEIISFASDIYALGVLLYQLITGQLPFASHNVLQMLKMLRDDEPLAPRQLNPDIPHDLETICLKCLMKKPTDRYTCAQALADDLNLFLQDEPIQAQPLNGLQRLIKWARHKPVLAASSVVVIFMYSLHLFAREVLHLPRHQGLFHTVLTISTLIFLSLLYLIQKMLESDKWQTLGQYSFMSLTVVALTMVFVFDAGAQSVPINVYMYLIMVAPLLSPHPQLIGFQTVLSMLGYLSLLALTHSLKPTLQVSMENAVFFVLNLGFTGVLTYLIVRRIRFFNSL